MGRMKARDSKRDSATLAALGRAIAKQRVKPKLTQEDLAHEAGIALRTLQNLEGGTLNPGYLTLKALAHGFKISVSELLDGL